MNNILFSVCDNCTQTLLDTVDEMIYQFQVNIDGINLHDLKAPWHKLTELTNYTDRYSNDFDEFFHAVDAVDNFNDIASDEVRFKIILINLFKNTLILHYKLIKLIINFF